MEGIALEVLWDQYRMDRVCAAAAGIMTAIVACAVKSLASMQITPTTSLIGYALIGSCQVIAAATPYIALIALVGLAILTATTYRAHQTAKAEALKAESSLQLKKDLEHLKSMARACFINHEPQQQKPRLIPPGSPLYTHVDRMKITIAQASRLSSLDQEFSRNLVNAMQVINALMQAQYLVNFSKHRSCNFTVPYSSAWGGGILSYNAVKSERIPNDLFDADPDYDTDSFDPTHQLTKDNLPAGNLANYLRLDE